MTVWCIQVIMVVVEAHQGKVVIETISGAVGTPVKQEAIDVMSMRRSMVEMLTMATNVEELWWRTRWFSFSVVRIENFSIFISFAASQGGRKIYMERELSTSSAGSIRLQHMNVYLHNHMWFDRICPCWDDLDPYKFFSYSELDQLLCIIRFCLIEVFDYFNYWHRQ